MIITLTIVCLSCVKSVAPGMISQLEKVTLLVVSFFKVWKKFITS